MPHQCHVSIHINLPMVGYTHSNLRFTPGTLTELLWNRQVYPCDSFKHCPDVAAEKKYNTCLQWLFSWLLHKWKWDSLLIFCQFITNARKKKFCIIFQCHFGNRESLSRSYLLSVACCSLLQHATLSCMPQVTVVFIKPMKCKTIQCSSKQCHWSCKQVQW